MKRLRRWLFNLVAGMSFALFVAAIVANVIAVLRPMSWCVHVTPAKSEFIRLDGWHLLLCRQSMSLESGTLPPTHQFNTSRFGSFGIAFPASPSGRWGLHIEEVVSQIGYKFGIHWFNGPVGSGSIPGTPASGSVGRTTCSLAKLGIPFWLLAVVFSIVPMLTSIRWWRVCRLRRTGHCMSCGYDLRATPDRCPECGTVPEPVKGVVE